MLDYLAIFTKGGALLWAWQLSALQVKRRFQCAGTLHAHWRKRLVMCRPLAAECSAAWLRLCTSAAQSCVGGCCYAVAHCAVCPLQLWQQVAGGLRAVSVWGPPADWAPGSPRGTAF